jgi:hypothetical protein
MKEFLIAATTFISSLFSPSPDKLIESRSSSIEQVRIAREKDYFTSKVQPIFDKKCIACHSCFNSPCQLKLTSYEGVMRGASKLSVYDFPKLKSRTPTRLYIDANTHEEWREKGFHSVTESKATGISVMEHLLTRLAGNNAGIQKVYKSEEAGVCMADTSAAEVEAMRITHPGGRMPFGMAALEKEEVQTIKTWLETGAKGPKLSKLESNILKHQSLRNKISEVESFLNNESIKHQITARYIYEHLFIASLFFNEAPDTYFRLVRSYTLQGDFDEVKTKYPYEEAKKKFYYRLRPLTHTLTLKSHIPFVIGQKKLRRWKQLFLEPKWNDKDLKMPPYGRSGSNPFQTFTMIPEDSRYRYLLDEAGYHIMTFIKGPVCRGQTALNVIRDQFWVTFVEPSKDPMVRSRTLSKKISKEMIFPAYIEDDFKPFISFRSRYWDAVEDKFNFLAKDGVKTGADFIWKGDKKNTNALLTVFRHFDSAKVVRGLRGRVPKTVWLIDYHVLESIYYNLVASYNVFGPLLHQINSRLYMEISRIASEDLYLSLLPKKNRVSLRDTWNQAVPGEKESLSLKLVDYLTEDTKNKMKFEFPYRGGVLDTKVKNIREGNENEDFFEQVKSQFSPSQLNNLSDLSPNRVKLVKTKEKEEEITTQEFLKKLALLPADVVQYLPDTILLRINDLPGKVFTLIHNKEHYNVSMLFLEDKRRKPGQDSLDVIPMVATNYVNLFVSISSRQLKSFYTQLSQAQKKSEVFRVLSQYGVSRFQENFFEHYAWFSKRTYNPLTNERGALDVNRYANLDFMSLK